MLDQIFINVGHLYKFPPQNINMHVYEHRQAVDMAGRKASVTWFGEIQLNQAKQVKEQQNGGSPNQAPEACRHWECMHCPL